MDSILVTLFISVILFLIIFLTIFIYAKIKAKQLYPVLVEITNKIGPKLYLFLLPFPFLYLFYYYFIFDSTEENSIVVNEYLKTISITFFSAGIFSATVKLINSLVIFKENFKKIVLSEDFDKTLTKKFDSITLSNDYLLTRSDLKDIWARVTLCKYEQQFPQLKNSIEHLVENDLYNESSLSYYYKNFRTQFKFELISEEVVLITEITSYKIVTSSKDKINFDFWLSYDDEEKSSDRSSKFKLEYLNIDQKSIDLKPSNKELEKPSIYKTHTAYTYHLEGNHEYFIERKTSIYQNMVIDPVFTFFSARLIDTLTIKIKNCENLNIFFSPIDKNVFIFDKQEYEGQSYLSEGILMPGEKFKIFMYKKVD